MALRLSEAYRRGFVGRELTVLPEHRTGGFWAAHGTYGFPIYIEEEERVRKNGPVTVRLQALYRDGLRGKIF